MKIAIIAKARNGALVAFRQRLGLTQAKAAELCGIGQREWSLCECMRFEHLGDNRIEAIAVAIDVHPYVIAPPEVRGRRIQWEQTAFVDVTPKQLVSIKSKTAALPSPTIDVKASGLRDRVERALLGLDGREREIIKMRYGIGCDRIYPLKEVAAKFGLTRERIRQIQKKAESNIAELEPDLASFLDLDD